jgi:competence protein ComEA
MALTANLNPPADNAAAPSARESQESGPAGKIDINSASADELDELPGIGPKLAQAIVEHRKAHGAFSSIEALLDVPGIGEAKLEALRGLIVADSKR